jgi:hypothetical protein
MKGDLVREPEVEYENLMVEVGLNNVQHPTSNHKS